MARGWRALERVPIRLAAASGNKPVGPHQDRRGAGLRPRTQILAMGPAVICSHRALTGVALHRPILPRAYISMLIAGVVAGVIAGGVQDTSTCRRWMEQELDGHRNTLLPLKRH